MPRAEADGRLDELVRDMGDLTRSRAAALITDGLVTVDGVQRTKPGFAVKLGQDVAFTVPEARELPLEKENLPLCVLYQDDDLAIVDKPSGMVTHPAAGNETGTLVQALLFHLDQLSGIGGVKRPGIVHRLDKDTSGLMMVAKNDKSHQALSDMLKARDLDKRYLAVVEGELREDAGRIDAPLARSKKDRKKMAVDNEGREAHTQWRVLARLRGATLIEAHILTGRTHQIRVHMASIGHPVLGDPLYGFKKGVPAPRLMLHSYSLALRHPTTGEELRFTCMPPEDYRKAVQKLQKSPPTKLPWDD